MLEKPDLNEQRIVTRLQEVYELRVMELAFLPLGADVSTAVYRAATSDGEIYFLKLRKESFDEITVTVPKFLQNAGVRSVLAPLETNQGRLSAELEGFTGVLYPFVEGQDGYQVALSEGQWVEFGASLGRIHSLELPPDLARRIPRENFSAQFRKAVRRYQTEVEERTYSDPAAIQCAATIKARRNEINRLVARAETLGFALPNRSLNWVLCHADIHAGNLLLTAKGDLFIVDWDNPVFAPKERDLMLIGGSFTWRERWMEERFFQGYGQVQLDDDALAYYRCERVIQDIEAFCRQLLASEDGGKDREQSLEYLENNFLPGHEVELALRSDG